MPPGKFGKRPGVLQPEGKSRVSQVVTTFGPGAMVDLIDHAVLIGGLEFWMHKDRKEAVLVEPRLRDAVQPLLGGRRLSLDEAFLVPPIGNDKEPTRFVGVQVLEFPSWFVCQNPECRALTRSKELQLKGGRYVHGCNRTKETECVPVRFVAACPKGHLDEFPWVWFTHRSLPGCTNPQLRLTEGATGDFSEVEVSCQNCPARERLSSAQEPKGNPPCRGKRPWLGPDSDEPDCAERQHLMVRTASHSYFSQVMSALSIPEQGRDLEDLVRKHWHDLKNVTAKTLPVLGDFHPETAALLAPFDSARVVEVITALREERPIPRKALRTAELEQFMASKPESDTDMPLATDRFYAKRAKLKDGLPKGIGTVVLAKKLREVRTQIGFSRLAPVSANLQGEYTGNDQSAALSQLANWLPANEIRGEGVLVVLDEKYLVEWEQRPAVLARARELLAGYDAFLAVTPGAPPFPGARFYLLHSLSHLLMSAISLECGYSASSIHERIYCAAADADDPMAAVLISTGTPGSEGTLGGLVEQGKRLKHHLQRAYDMGILCSNDPVCGTHSPKEDLGERHLEGAACHGCLFVAESSCERFNRYLDRALVVPTMGHEPELAYFGKRP